MGVVKSVSYWLMVEEHTSHVNTFLSGSSYSGVYESIA